MAPPLPLASPVFAARTVFVCADCGETDDPGPDVCAAHDAELTSVTLDSSYLAPREHATATTLTTAQIDTVRAWLDGITARGSELTWHERDVLTSCLDAQDPRLVRRLRAEVARGVVANAFNALQRGA